MDDIRITVDGRPVETTAGSFLLDVLRSRGLDIPTLCHHPSLEPHGACRLCSVEVGHPDWNGYRRLVTSCNYPVRDGLEVFTRSEAVNRARKMLLELYLARCPRSRTIVDLARTYGVDGTSLELRPDADDCILCGLCTSVCQELGPGAISTLYRGTGKKVGPGPDDRAVDCTGCLSCAHVCPTGAIGYEHGGDCTLSIWGRTFDIEPAVVTPQDCRACGICEEVCPLSVPRVSAMKNGVFVSRISRSDCIGCGICAGACPAGAISLERRERVEGNPSQPGSSGRSVSTPVVFACRRTKLPPSVAAEVVSVPCLGSVGLAEILSRLAAGNDAVLLLCRDKDTCPYAAGGEAAQERAVLCAELARSIGLGEGRVRFVRPDNGRRGPLKAVEDFLSSLSPTPLEEGLDLSGAPGGGLDLALDIIERLKDRPELEARLPAGLEQVFPGPDQEGAAPDALLYLGELPELDLLMSRLLPDWKLWDVLEAGVRLLERKGVRVTPALSRRAVEESGIDTVYVFGKCRPFERQVKLVHLDELAGAGTVEPVVSSFRLDRSTVDRMVQAVEAAVEKGGRLRCASPFELAQFRLFLREGAWRRTGTVEPYLAFQRQAEAEAVHENAAGEDRCDLRLRSHPILQPLEEPTVEFTFNGRPLMARKGEVITSALYAAGISVFGHHHRDGGAQGIYCVNGQCSQCMVIADGRPVKGCMVPVEPGMKVESCEGRPALEDGEGPDGNGRVRPRLDEYSTTVLIVGGGPAGLCAAIELGRLGVDCLVVDDKQELGGKLGLQTHNFFGSVADCFAGMRGMDIGRLIADEVSSLPTVKVWSGSTVVACYDDHKLGVACPDGFRLVSPEVLLVTAGAREKSLVFPGCDLPGVYGAGAFQTLVNRDMVRCAERLFVIGGGNVGLIGAYHALQAGVDVVGLVEALPRCGGYKVHEDKIKRLGVPVWTSHTVLRAEGVERVEAVVTAAVDESFRPVPGTERRFEVDTVLVAVGLSPVSEILTKARQYGMKVYAAGDAEEIAEASAAIFSGKIVGRRIAGELGIDIAVPAHWESFGDVLKHRPAAPVPLELEELGGEVRPIVRCVQEIPCNPCTEACPKGLISMGESILELPRFDGECIGCGRCVLACPGLAISLLYERYDPNGEKALVVLPFEFGDDRIRVGGSVVTTGMEGERTGTGKVVAVRSGRRQGLRRLVMLEVPFDERLDVAGFRIREPEEGEPVSQAGNDTERPEASAAGDDPIVCRCERVRKSEIVAEIRAGVRDMNMLKGSLRVCAGACGGKTCKELIMRIFREEGVDPSDVTPMTTRPLVAEVHLGDFVEREEGGADVE